VPADAERTWRARSPLSPCAGGFHGERPPRFDVGDQRVDRFDVLAAGQRDGDRPGPVEAQGASPARADDQARQRGRRECLERREPMRVEAVDRQGHDRLSPDGDPNRATATKFGEPSLDLHLPRRPEQTRNDARVPVAHLLMFHAWTS